MRVSQTTLIVLAAAVWYTGAAVLLWKGAERMLEAAAALGPGWPLTAAIVGLGLGVIQGATVFRRSSVRNLDRIRALESPRAWQFFRPRFFLALAAMIGGAAALGVIAGAGPIAATVVGAIDWVIGFSLLVSSAAFRAERGLAAEELEPTG